MKNESKEKNIFTLPKTRKLGSKLRINVLKGGKVIVQQNPVQVTILEKKNK